MLTEPPLLQKAPTSHSDNKQRFSTDNAAIAFLILAMLYLALGSFFGLLGSFQYVLPSFLREHLSFQKTRPLHVYLVTAWIFTAAQGAIYYYLPRLARRNLYWQKGPYVHLILQLLTSIVIITAFFMGRFGGREYLEFPPLLGLCIAAAWLPFAINFFGTIKLNLRQSPVYVYSWTIGVIFFYLTLAESYLWLFDWFRNNEIRDITIQWKALGSMVGSWNMLIFGCTMYVMEQMSGNEKMNRSPMAFFFFFVGFTNLLFNWGHHTYIVPAAPWVKNIAYIISMTELLIFGNLLFQFRRNLAKAQQNFHLLPYRLFSFADWWIFLNLGVAIAMSIPAINQYTHGTHITVAHAMGATIGINTMLLLGSVFYIAQQQKPFVLRSHKKMAGLGIGLTNLALLFFWAALIGSGLVKIFSQLQQQPFAIMMQKSQPLFRMFALSGVFILVGLLITTFAACIILFKKDSLLASKLHTDDRVLINL